MSTGVTPAVEVKQVKQVRLCVDERVSKQVPFADAKQIAEVRISRPTTRKEDVMSASAKITSPAQFRESKTAHFLFADPRASVLWLVVRIWLGLQWIEAGWHKVTDSAWVGSEAGAGITGFVKGAIAKSIVSETNPRPSVQGWYASYLETFVLPYAEIYSYVVAFGELAVGLGLILGMLTGIAAFFGVVMNTNFLLAGTVSTNPILAIPAIFIILAWRNAGWLGLDRFVLPLVGTPWQPGNVFDHTESKK